MVLLFKNRALCVCLSLISRWQRCHSGGISRRRIVTGSVRGDVITVRPARAGALRSGWVVCGSAGAEGLDVLLEVWVVCQWVSPPISPSPLISHISFECELISKVMLPQDREKHTHILTHRREAIVELPQLVFRLVIYPCTFEIETFKRRTVMSFVSWHPAGR